MSNRVLSRNRVGQTILTYPESAYIVVSVNACPCGTVFAQEGYDYVTVTIPVNMFGHEVYICGKWFDDTEPSTIRWATYSPFGTKENI